MARILVIGGSGTISGHAVDALVAAAHDVVVFNRGQRDGAARDSRVRRIRGDRDDRVALSDAVGSVRPDVLIDFVCFDPAQAQALANTVRGQVGHLVFISSVDVFGFPLRTLPVPETAPINPAVGTYAEKKRLCEEFLREHQGHDPPLTIVRPTFSMGPRFVIAFFSPSSAVMMNRVRRSLPVVVPGDGQTLIHPSASRDTGAMIARVAGEPIAFGKTYTGGTDGSFMPQDSYVGLIGSVLGHEPIIVHVPKELLAGAHVSEITDGIYNNVTRFDLAFAFDQFKADFPDFRWRSDLVDPIRAYVARLEAEGAFREIPTRGIDDALIDGWGEASAVFASLAV